MRNLKLRLLAYLAGMREFRLSVTTNFEDHGLLEAYHRGRDRAHRLTFRLYDYD